jgi:predicted nucleic acid-binding protein
VATRESRDPAVATRLGGAGLTTFLDTSALLKRYVEETGTAAALALEDSVLVVSALTRVEATAALWRKRRLGELGPADAARLSASLGSDLAPGSGGPFAVVAVTGALLAEAAALTERHPLRAGDAIQLASALAARDADPALDRFATADRTLAEAAERERFMAVPGL